MNHTRILGMNKDNPVLMYVLIRTDLASMTSGRACAQACHAANYCVEKVKVYNQSLYDEWAGETWQFFGTTIVLGGTWDVLMGVALALGKADRFRSRFNWGIVHDPEYSVQDGDVVHLIPLDTCIWVFGRKNDLAPYLEELPLFGQGWPQWPVI